MKSKVIFKKREFFLLKDLAAKKPAFKKAFQGANKVEEGMAVALTKKELLDLASLVEGELDRSKDKNTEKSLTEICDYLDDAIDDLDVE
jgi:hypothetical protein